MAYGNRNRIEGGTLPGNDSATGLSDILLNVHKIQLGLFDAGCGDQLVALQDRHVGNVGNGPGNEGGVPMLTEYICVYIALADVVVLRQSCTQTGSIQNRTGTDDPVFRQVGELVECVGQNIYRITYYNISSVGCMSGDFRDNALGNVDIGLRQLQTGLTRLSCNTGCQDHNVRILCIHIAACVNGAGAAEGGALSDIQRFAQSLFAVDINHDDFGRHSHNGQRVRNGGTNAAGSDDGDFVHKYTPSQ